MADPNRPDTGYVELNADTPAPDGGATQSTPYGQDAVLDPLLIPGFELLEVIGRGGMGVVYKARQLALNRLVAVKVLPNAERATQNAVARFFAEAQSVADVEHPHVVGVYDFGEASRVPYLVMELLDGGSLDDPSFQAECREPRRAAGVLAKVCRGVAAAHAAGIVHRDLKPNNILFTPAGEPKVVDFGLAKRAMSNLTQSVAVMGTPYYMSPEQAKGKSKSVGPASDVWAVGVMLYECLTGIKPFDADNQFSLLHQIISEEPEPPRIHNAALPPQLELIILKCLRKRPEQRYPSATKLAEALERFVQENQSLVPLEVVRRPTKREPGPAATLLILGLCGIAAAAVWLWHNAEAEKRDLHQKAREGQIAK